ncbi:helix-turn-helix domain-containing protein [Paenibacillus spongiae]|uniref:AraC family transcriptional regulator n=1 Tax=Paenibacillus spongiae TaxID=2909671 RepID=A0ABY5S6D7_9BACL|nr:AraC family transcriptional regulator [Paenibacillus spongiae]UVI29048.1 AraC family transcriptional regulator [Paenibacillus spongiae]
MKEYMHEYAVDYLFNPSDFLKKGGIWILRAGANRAKPNYQVGPRRIEYYSMHFVVDGSVSYRYPDGAVTLGKGDVFCLFPGTVHEYGVVPSDRPLRMHWLAFDGPQAPDLAASLGISPQHPYGSGLLDGNGLHLLQQTIEAPPNGPDMEMRHLSLIYSLFANLQSRLSKAAEGGEGWLEDCLRYMQTHFAEDIGVSNIAERFNLHRSYLSAMVKRHIGQSPGQYIQSLRLEKGARLLKETEHSVTEIALSSGYPDLYSFSRAFSRKYGVAPTEYRQAQEETARPVSRERS